MSKWSLVHTEDGSRSLRSERFHEACHSSVGALAETRYVSLELSGVSARLRAGEPTRVLEIGFGTGLGLLLTAEFARIASTALDFVSVECDLLDAATYRSLEFEAHLVDRELVDHFEEALRNHRAEPVLAGRFDPRTSYCVHLGDARAIAFEAEAFDACYFDAFSPEVNPELWTEDFLARVVAALRPGARLSTYCVQGEVRRRFQSLGMEVAKRAGLGRKREVMVATKPPLSRP